MTNSNEINDASKSDLVSRGDARFWVDQEMSELSDFLNDYHARVADDIPGFSYETSEYIAADDRYVQLHILAEDLA